MLMSLAPAGASVDAERSLAVFSVTSASGASVASSALSTEPRWLLIYVTPACKSCDRLIESLEQWQSPQLTARTVIVVRGQNAARYVADHKSPDLDAAWYTDEDDHGWRSLDLKSAPALIGVEHGEVKWAVSGVLNDPKTVEPMVRRWVEY